MTENRPGPVRAKLPRVSWIALLATGGLLAACANNTATPAGSTQRVYAANLAGAAKVCDAPAVTPSGDAVTDATIKLANDGGWCGLRLRQDGTKPFDAGLLLARPEHGSVLIHEVGDDTRIDYTPDRRFAGNDFFTVKLIPGGHKIHVAVTVTAP